MEHRQAPATGPTDAGKDAQPLHGGLLLALLVVPLFVPPLRRWPWYLLVPLGAYLLVVAVVAPLRRTVRWNRVGRLTMPVLAATGAIIVISTSALLLYDAVFRPDLAPLSRRLPLGLPLPVAVVRVLFAACNALLEEVIFRGVLLDALAAAVGGTGAVIAQAVAFGVGHAHGYPPGGLGMVLAAVYGLMLGALRQRAGGLAAPWAAHVCADATIFWIVVTASGARS
jgi:membrane protease YdiL (CAAX protease family)